MVLRFFLLVSVFLFMYCAVPERDDPDDPKSTYYRGSVSPGSSSGSTQTGIIYGTPVTYDGETYQTVVIGTQTWMARNLNYNASGSKCGNGSSLSDENTSTCDTYGRLYNWATANTVCPSGWHLPSDAEWTTLTDYVGGSSTAGTKLKATSGWSSEGNGTDAYGFAALPGIYGYSDGSFSYVGTYGNWWSATEHGGLVYSRSMYYGRADVGIESNVKALLRSVRCVKD
jgi:uncharacterized protein (TIGR02145 family)